MYRRRWLNYRQTGEDWNKLITDIFFLSQPVWLLSNQRQGSCRGMSKCFFFFLQVPALKMDRVEVVDLFFYYYFLKYTFWRLCQMWVSFVSKFDILLITALSKVELKNPFAQMWYIKNIIVIICRTQQFVFSLSTFSYIDFPPQFCVFYRKIT